MLSDKITIHVGKPVAKKVTENSCDSTGQDWHVWRSFVVTEEREQRGGGLNTWE